MKRKPKLLHKQRTSVKLVMPPLTTELEESLHWLLGRAEAHIKRLEEQNALISRQLSDLAYYHTRYNWLEKHGHREEFFSDGTSQIVDQDGKVVSP